MESQSQNHEFRNNPETFTHARINNNESFSLLINVKMPTIHLHVLKQEKILILHFFSYYEQSKCLAQLS